MRLIEPDLANEIVQIIGWKDLHDTDTVITKKELERALQYFDNKKILKQIEELYKNDVKTRIQAGIKTPRNLMTLLRRVLRRHKISVVYDRCYEKNKVYFKYRLVC
jgi:hypothetical protein